MLEMSVNSFYYLVANIKI